MRRIWLSFAMLAAGCGLFATGQLADAASSGGGVLRVGFQGSSGPVDPQVSNISTTWWLEYATAAKLYNYPDRRGPAGSVFRPEVASRYTVSNAGKRYTFFIRKGFRFSDGTPVAASNFAYAIDRAVNHDLDTHYAADFITDPKGTNIVGAEDVRRGVATHVSGVNVRGNKLIINLVQPDGTFLSKITMPYFQATSTKLPINREVRDVRSLADLPSAGPYTFTFHDADNTTRIVRNPYWRRGPGRQRPRNLDGLTILWNRNEETSYNQVLRGELDEVWAPAAHVQELADRYGVNRTRFWTKPVNCTGYLPLNMANDLFKGNPQLRKAINYAIDRRAFLAVVGPYAGQPWTHLLNPGIPGWKNVSPYPIKPDLTKARRLAAGHFRDGKITVYYWSGGTIAPAQAQIVRQGLIDLGFEPDNITMHGWWGGIYVPYERRGTDMDIAVPHGWCSDYPDPYDLIDVLLNGHRIVAENNTNVSYMNNPKWNARMDAAAKLVGPKRYKVYGQMDIDLMRQVAPIVPMRTYNARYFFSDRVDPKSLVYQGIYSDWSIPALALK